MGSIRRVREWIVNEEIEDRLLVIALMVAIPYFLSSIAFDLIESERVLYLIIDSSFLVLCITFLLLSRKKKLRPYLIGIFSALITIGFVFFWQISGGILGGAAYIFSVLIVLLILMNKGRVKVFYTILSVVLVFLLTSDYITVTGENNYTGLLFDFVLNLVVLAMLLMIFKLALDKERSELEIQNEQMEELNRKVVIKSAELQDYNKEIELIQENLERLVDQRAAKLEEENERDLEYSFINAHLVRAPIANMLAVIQLLENENPQLDDLRVNVLQLDSTVREIGKVLAEDR